MTCIKTGSLAGFIVYHSIADPRDMVGATGFEPATFSSRTRRATKLRYAPKMARILQKSFVAQDVTPDFFTRRAGPVRRAEACRAV